jgi:iron complex outermembrane receptor protein
MIRAPKWTAGVNVSYYVPIQVGKLQFTANYSYNDGYFWEPSNRLRQGSYGVLNAEIAFTSRDDAWRLRVFGRNLTDKLYYSSVSEQALGDIATAQAPRMYGLGVDYRWGAK